jgi:hypothetical protein
VKNFQENNMKKYRLSKLLLAGLISAFSVFSQSTMAASCTSSGLVNSQTVSATLGSVPTSTDCTDMVKGNLEHKEDLTAFGMDWVLLVKDVNVGAPGTADNGATAGALVITQTGTGDILAGTWAIDNAKTGIYDTFVIGLKPGAGVAYWMVDELTGTFSDLTHNLSHSNLYGKVAPVPLPAAAWLFGSALLGLGAMKRKRI